MEVRTVCAHCDRPMELRIDSDLRIEAVGEGCAPYLFVPAVNLYALEAESIIDDF